VGKRIGYDVAFLNAVGRARYPPLADELAAEAA